MWRNLDRKGFKEAKRKRKKIRRERKIKEQHEKGSRVGVGQFCLGLIITCFIFSHFTLFYLALADFGFILMFDCGH